jgi:outer membrane lipoprotein-sorting protein
MKIRFLRNLLIIAMLSLLAAGVSVQAGPEETPGESAVPAVENLPDAAAIIREIDRIYRADSSYTRLTMRIVTDNWERILDLECWTAGMDRTFIVINSPLKDRGITTLRVGNEMWNYFPKIDKVMKAPPSMMMGSWMGSDFTNDDLVKESTFLDDYTYRLVEGEDSACYYLELTPRPETVTVWARVVIRADRKTLLPREQLYYDADGALMRKITFGDVRTLGGRNIPTVMELVPMNKPGNKTVITYVEAEFDQALDEATFTLRNLQKKR